MTGNLLVVLLVAILLVFTVLLVEFRSFYEPVAIVFGSILALAATLAVYYLLLQLRGRGKIRSETRNAT